MTNAPKDIGTSYPLPSIDGAIVAEAESNPVRHKSFRFALMMVGLCRELQGAHEYVISRQLMKSGTAIGANIEEAVSAESRKDFLHKMNIALKEARESHYWLRLLDASEIDTKHDLKEHLANADELVRILVSITRTISRS